MVVNAVSHAIIDYVAMPRCDRISYTADHMRSMDLAELKDHQRVFNLPVSKDYVEKNVFGVEGCHEKISSVFNNRICFHAFCNLHYIGHGP